MNELVNLSISELRTLLDKNEISPRMLAQAFLRRIKEKDEDIGAFITVCGEKALDLADKNDDCHGKSMLCGIPYALKDNICTKGIKTTCSSKMLENFVPCYDATAKRILDEKNAVLLGKLNMDEFGMGNSTENSIFGATKNPLNREFVPGGSSGGCAAAVAAGFVPFALGSDTGGSVRQPAAFCSVVGMKPSYGAVSRYGLVGFAPSLEQIGPITKTVYDNAVVFSEIAAYDKKDAVSKSVNYDVISGIKKGIKGVKIAVPKEFDASTDKVIEENILSAARAFEQLGAEIEFVSLPSYKDALNAYYILSSAEASSELARFDGVRYGYSSDENEDYEKRYKNTRTKGFGDEVKRRILLGTYVLREGYYDEYYKKALSARIRITNEYKEILGKYDLVLLPVAPALPHKIGEKRDVLKAYSDDVYTVIANITGFPAISVNCGQSRDGLAVGMQLMGKAFDEALVYRAAYCYEQAREGGK